MRSPLSQHHFVERNSRLQAQYLLGGTGAAPPNNSDGD
ncbi:hypothetical protein S7335_4941 [Synechococcus sp. PCC 7335]|nr:hypothetical protein S7335_4941 [Synechococcus sp. PCC 7335]